MTPLQEERLRTLEQQAIDAFLDDANFQVEEWLNKDDAKEYCELYNMQHEEANCLCGQHESWK
jgi:hypothetical protein